ncbi:MAG: hypothetical protein LKG11_04910 [Bacilli bacterium]|jgi:hypothetical protein|nr:hypothetical protein [Bacilli bacterium]
MLHFGRSSDPNKSFRFWKVLTVALTTVFAVYCVSACASLEKGAGVSADALPGVYVSASDHYVLIRDGSSGRLVSGKVSFDFSYEYSSGALDCDGETDFVIRVLGNGDFYSLYDFSYLFKRGVER